ncbi:hypothetical protein LINGRAHAP2_LOCUS9422, partial [Linum grandiflorum]
WIRKPRSSFCWRRVRSHTNTLRRSPVSVSCLIRTGWSKVEHLYREGNQAVGYLASHGHSLLVGVHSIIVSDRSNFVDTRFVQLA